MDAAAQQNLEKVRQMALQNYFIADSEGRDGDAGNWQEVYRMAGQLAGNTPTLVEEPAPPEVEPLPFEVLPEPEDTPAKPEMLPDSFFLGQSRGEPSLCFYGGKVMRPYTQHIRQSALFQMADMMEKEFGMGSFADPPRRNDPTRKEIMVALAEKGFRVPDCWVNNFGRWLLHTGIWKDDSHNGRNPIEVGFAAAVREHWETLTPQEK